MAYPRKRRKRATASETGCIVAFVLALLPFAMLYSFVSTLFGIEIPDSHPKEEIILPNLQPTLSTMEVHFLDVGQGDAAIILCDGQVMMIDGGPAKKSSLIYTYLKETLNLNHIDYLVASHHDGDHTGGLSAAMNACSVGVIVYPPIPNLDSAQGEDVGKFASYVSAYMEDHPAQLIIPDQQQRFAIGSATATCISFGDGTDNSNNSSIVIRIDHGSNSFLFTGDIQTDKEQMLVDSQNLSATVLKVSHHGSATSTSSAFLHAVSPQYAIISVGEGNAYGFPDQDVISRITDSGAKVYRTDICGHIVLKSDGVSISVATQRHSFFPESTPIPEYPDTSLTLGTYYIGNKRTCIFHFSTCPSVYEMSEKNKISIPCREEAIQKNYVPCQRCQP